MGINRSLASQLRAKGSINKAKQLLQIATVAKNYDTALRPSKLTKKQAGHVEFYLDETGEELNMILSQKASFNKQVHRGHLSLKWLFTRESNMTVGGIIAVFLEENITQQHNWEPDARALHYIADLALTNYGNQYAKTESWSCNDTFNYALDVSLKAAQLSGEHISALGKAVSSVVFTGELQIWRKE